MSEYNRYQDRQDKIYVEACKDHGIPPLIYHDGTPSHGDDHDPFATIEAPSSDREFDEPEEPTEKMYSASEMAAMSLAILQKIAGDQDPELRIRADCILAILNRSDESSQAAIARKYGLERATVSKKMKEIRAQDNLGRKLKIFYFGGREEDSESARQRTTEAHKKRKEQEKLWKPTTELSKYLQKLT